ncbi:putative signal recognition particle 9 kDa protein [Paratrimastix pyriformis]|uniref:Signal recognition particle 9 kDa protein n=1 Tax=Paratrimastix pyriformis TaxID=342808 RepID=A0ABQ8UQP1_9EUKA|nr:putative signal recognition particle 9 kDa protein [Paratrimastix pyriformis]
MVYFENWDEFMDEAEKLVVANPSGTRYVVKYRNKDGKLVLKVTDDQACLKYRTDQLQDVKKIERLTNLFLRVTTGAS